VEIPLLARALAAFLIFPMMVGFVIPLWLLGRGAEMRTFHPLGIVPLSAGTGLLLWCVRDFYVIGSGTLAPWDPPRRLVVIGLYRWSRNPMYVAVSLILLGWATAFRSCGLLSYALIMMVVFHLRVVLFEEPWLARTHGELWKRYRSRVPRWLGVRRRSA
jgi:protein-S-isoprenylcysteine O-methyltransferase Ste14